MNKPPKWWEQPPALVLAWALAAAIVIYALAWALRFVLPAIGVTFALVVAAVLHGTVAGISSAWVAPVTTASMVTVTCFSMVGIYTIGINIVKEATSKPFIALVTALAVLESFTLDFCQEFYPGEPFSQLLLKAATGLLFAIASVLWRQPKPITKVLSVFLYGLFPMMVLLLAAQPYFHLGITAAFREVDPGTWYAIAGFVLMVLAVFLADRVVTD